ncbi:Hgh1p [Sugiyamaella lignohabitans]|uniref:Hgh1p n=1 Tax=Sugiyamaella lignohabitans TaxID=796027 RepID=A0A167DFC0_9ASCO|nr:Hgh1p [Sugiyamaella lignohabitans]ANB12853.1 Hgh1p [Sugiyamaella lignohabitans]
MLDQYNGDLFCILLANLSKNDQVTKLFEFKRQKRSADSTDSNKKTPSSEIVTLENETFKSDNVMDCLMDCFVKGSERTLNKMADFDYLAFFFADISRFREGREYFVTEQEYDGVVPITKLLVFTESESKTRRAGVASTIKNSLFQVQAHEKLVTDPSINLLPYILLPLAGPEDIPEDELFNLPDELQLLPPDKKRDPDHQILCTHVESLLLLSTTRPMREYMREKSVYPIIRELHLAIDDEVVQDPCERLVQMLMRDEAPEEKITEEDDEDGDEIVEIL